MENNNNGGISILSLLGVVFITLKLTGYIDWSWWYVTMPFWGGLALSITIIIMYLAILSIKELFQK